MRKSNDLFSKVVFLVAGLYSFALLVSIFFGVYFLGDTISHLQYASLGGPLTTFIQHDGLWPPLVALLLNIVLKLPGSMYLLSSIFVAVVFISYFGISTVFFQLFIKNWKTGFVIAALTLVGPVGLIMQSLLSEPFLLVLWMASLFCVAQFWITSKEKWLVSWLVISALLPLTRYLGIVAVTWMSLALLCKLFLDIYNKKNKTYSLWLLTLSLCMVWIPLAFYLFRTKVMIGTFLPIRVVQEIETAGTIITRFITTITKDLSLLAPTAFFLGLITNTKKKVRHLSFFVLLLLGAGVSYLLALLISEIKYFVLPYLPSRYVGVSYPFLLGGMVAGGSWLSSYLQQKKKFKLPSVFRWLTLFLLIGIFIFSSFITTQQLGNETKDLSSTVSEVAWTGDLEKLCDQTKQKYLVAHIHSRNWLAWSYAYFCNGTVLLQQSARIEKDALVISAYSLDNENLIEQNILNINNYATYFYLSTQSAELDVDQAFSSRGEFE